MNTPPPFPPVKDLPSASPLAQQQLQDRLLSFFKYFSLLGILHLIYFGLLILFAPPSLRVQYIPDDAFYYLELSKNFSDYKYWTFDSGISVTSGFHLLNAYLLTGLYTLLKPGTESFVQISAAVGILLTASMAALVWRKAWRNRNLYLLIFLATTTTTPNFLLNSISITEWSLGLTLAVCYFYFFHRSITEQENFAKILFLLGLAMSLARSDSGLLPLSIWIADLHVRGAKKATASFIGLAGAAVGVSLLLAHNWYFTNEFLQASAKVKAHWAQIQGVAGAGSIVTLVQIFSVLGLDLTPEGFRQSSTIFAVEVLLAPILLIGLGWKTRHQKTLTSGIGLVEPERQRLALPLAAFLCLISYMLFYRFSIGQQQWYTVNLIVPVTCLYTTAGWYLHKRLLPETNLTAIWFTLAAFITIGFNVWSLYPLNGLNAPWPHQSAVRAAGIYLNDNPLDQQVGSWNAGIIGYYQGGQVVNLDGLANNDAARYVIDNRLDNYITQTQIGYLIDFDNMFLIPRFALRGGYVNAPFLAKLSPIQTFDNGQFPEWKFLRLYKIK